MKMTLIAAVAESGLIGRNNDLPWKISEDLKFFKRTTMDHVMLMGANTWRSFGSRCLPNRFHVIVTNKPQRIHASIEDSGRYAISSDLKLGISIAKSEARKRGQDEFFVIGGASIYRQTIDMADKVILTTVWGDWPLQDGDVVFPTMSPEWVGVEPGEHRVDNGYSYSLGRTYERRNADL